MQKTIKVKTILSKIKNAPDNWFGTSYSMNLYRGCQHNCIYCDSRSKVYQIENFSDILVKENALELLEKELYKKRTKATIGFGSMNDPYMPIEKDLELTRRALLIIAKYRFPVHIITKSNLIVRDIDLLQKISLTYCCVSITITTPDDTISQQIEPDAPVSSIRFGAIKELNKNGIYCGLALMPVLPYLTDKKEHIFDLVKMAKNADAKFILFAPAVTLREGQREYFYEKLKKINPQLKEIYEGKAGNNYVFSPINVKELSNVFYEACKKFNIPLQPKFYSEPKAEQLKLF